MMGVIEGFTGKQKKGFTLIEVLIATFIFALLILGLYFIFDKSHSAWQKGDIRLEQYQKAREFLDIITHELKGAFRGQGRKDSFFQGTRNRILFLSSSNVPDEEGEYDLKQIEYKLVDHKLIRRVRSVLSGEENSGASSIVASGVKQLKFSYHDGINWQAIWNIKKEDGDSHPLPEAVQIELAVSGENEPPLTLSTLVHIPLS